MNRTTQIISIILLGLTISGCSVIQSFGRTITKASTQHAPKKVVVTPKKIVNKPKKVVRLVSNNCTYIIRDLSSHNSNVVWCRPKPKR